MLPSQAATLVFIAFQILNFARYFGQLWKFSTLTKNSRFCDLTRLISNWIIYLKTLASNKKKCVRESVLCIKSYVCGSLFTLRMCNIRRRKLFSCIFVQFPHEPSATVFVLIKNLHFMVEYVQEKLYFSNVGQKKKFYFTTHYSLYSKAHDPHN